MFENIDIQIKPRESMTWKEFQENTPAYSMALDGFVSDAPKYDSLNKHINFDHHCNVQRGATMSTAEQVMYAVKGGLMKHFKDKENPLPHVYINDCDQDVALSLFILENHKLFEGAASIPSFNRLLEIDSRLDITGGAYPMNLNDRLLKQHHWVFEPYTNMRKSGRLSYADASAIQDNIESVSTRIWKHMNGDGGEATLDTRHEIFYQGELFWIAHEIGGPDARYDIYSKGMQAFVNLVAKRDDGRNVWSIGKLSEYVPFPINELFEVYNKIEGCSGSDKWGGSNLIGGSPRNTGSKLNWEQIRDITEKYLKDKS